MMAIKLRMAVVYLATGMFFLVAATALLQADSTLDAFIKAGVSCAVVTCAGMMLVQVVDGATKAARVPASAKVSAASGNGRTGEPAREMAAAGQTGGAAAAVQA